MKTIKNIMVFVLAMLAMLCLFCESENVAALLLVKAAGFGLLYAVSRMVEPQVEQQS